MAALFLGRQLLRKDFQHFRLANAVRTPDANWDLLARCQLAASKVVPIYPVPFLKALVRPDNGLDKILYFFSVGSYSKGLLAANHGT